MPKKPDFDTEMAEGNDRTIRKTREQVRKIIENAAQEQGCEGVCTSWILIAELSGVDEEGDQIRTMFVDHAYHDGTGLAPWVLFGMVDWAMAGARE